MDEERFRQLVKEALDNLPQEFAKRISNVSIVIEDIPSKELLKSLKLPPWALLFGLYQGVPQTKRGVYSGVLPDKITIFKKPIEEEALLLLEDRFSNNRHVYTIAKMTEEEEAKMFQSGVQKLVIDTVWHEVAHHFGLDEEKVEEREKQRRRPKVERV